MKDLDDENSPSSNVVGSIYSGDRLKQKRRMFKTFVGAIAMVYADYLTQTVGNYPSRDILAIAMTTCAYFSLWQMDLPENESYVRTGLAEGFVRVSTQTTFSLLLTRLGRHTLFASASFAAVFLLIAMAPQWFSSSVFLSCHKNFENGRHIARSSWGAQLRRSRRLLYETAAFVYSSVLSTQIEALGAVHAFAAFFSVLSAVLPVVIWNLRPLEHKSDVIYVAVDLLESMSEVITLCTLRLFYSATPLGYLEFAGAVLLLLRFSRPLWLFKVPLLTNYLPKVRSERDDVVWSCPESADGDYCLKGPDDNKDEDEGDDDDDDDNDSGHLYNMMISTTAQLYADQMALWIGSHPYCGLIAIFCLFVASVAMLVDLSSIDIDETSKMVSRLFLGLSRCFVQLGAQLLMQTVRARDNPLAHAVSAILILVVLCPGPVWFEYAL